MQIVRFFIENMRWLSAGILLTFLSSFGQTFFISLFAGEIKQSFGLSDGGWGLVYTLGTSASAAAMIWAGALTDHIRTRVLGPMALGGLAVACLWMASNESRIALVGVIFALRFAGQGMVSHIAVVSMSRWFTAARGKALSIARMGFSLGEALLPVTFVALMLVVDWHFLWIVAAVAALASAPLLYRMLLQERTPQSFASQEDSTGLHGRHWSRAEVFRHYLFWALVPSTFGLSAFGTAFFFHQVHFAEIKGWSHLSLVALFPVYTGLSTVAMFGFGIALDRVGAARLIPFSLLPLVAGFVLFALGQSLWTTAAGLVFFALSAGAFSVLPNAFWAEFYGTKALGAIKALAAAVMVLGSAVGPGLTGLLIDAGVGLDRQYLAIALYFLGTTIILAMGLRKARREDRSPRSP